MFFENADLCQRCGVEDPDCRTLWHAATYSMGETKKVPYVPVQARGALHEQDGIKELLMTGLRVPTFAETPVSPEWKNTFFLLRVCKRCRADWLSALENWFTQTPLPRETVGSGIFVRRNGVSHEITKEEWEHLYASRKGET